jgi:hypothetical protein
MVATGTPSGGNVSITIEAHKQFGFEAGIAGLAAYTAVSTVMCFT